MAKVLEAKIVLELAPDEAQAVCWLTGHQASAYTGITKEEYGRKPHFRYFTATNAIYAALTRAGVPCLEVCD